MRAECGLGKGRVGVGEGGGALGRGGGGRGGAESNLVTRESFARGFFISRNFAREFFSRLYDRLSSLGACSQARLLYIRLIT